MKNSVFSYDFYIPAEEQIKLRLDIERHTMQHSHEFIEFVYVVAGEAMHLVGDRSHMIREGDFFLLDAGVEHAFDSAGKGIRICNCIFNPHFLNEIIGEDDSFIELAHQFLFNSDYEREDCGGYVYLPAEKAGSLKNIILDMWQEYQEKRSEYLQVLRAELMALLIKFFRLSGSDSVEESKWKKDAFKEIIEYVEHHCIRELSVNALSRAMFFSPSYISKIFRQRTNQSLAKFIQQKKMEHAKNLLLNSDMSIEEIMAETGYSDRKHFYKLFSEYYNETPGKYRDKNNG